MTAALAALTVGGYFFNRHVLQSNFSVVVPGKVYRSGQPSMSQLQAWIPKYGIRSIVNLRGDTLDICRQEKAVADTMNVQTISLALSSRHVVSKARLLRLIDAIDHAPRPMLMHCYFGVDRSGLAAMLAVLAEGKSDYQTARRQLARPLLRVGSHKVHINDTLDPYEEYCRRNNLDPNQWEQFKLWARDVYQPGAAEDEPRAAE